MYSVSAWFSDCSWPSRALTTSPIEMMPDSTASSSTTGQVAEAALGHRRHQLLDGVAAAHVTTVVDITDATVRPRALAPWAARARTTSRSETMPSMWRPSLDTTSAPMPRSRSWATASVSDACW